MNYIERIKSELTEDFINGLKRLSKNIMLGSRRQFDVVEEMVTDLMKWKIS